MKSMTGMGRASGLVNGTQVRVEIKTVNHRYCEIHYRSPGKYASLEVPLQALVKSFIGRGRVDIFVNEEKTVDMPAADLEAFRSYHSYLTVLKEALNIKNEVTLDQVLSGASNWLQREINVKEAWTDFEPIFTSALKDLNGMREREGLSLKENIKDRFLSLYKIRDEIKKNAEGIAQEIAARLKQRIQDRMTDLKDLDPQRLNAEVVYYLDRIDISEELERLESHRGQIETMLTSKDSVGRKIDFLLQEFNREFNTIGSKSQNATIAHLIVEAKTELEKIREQIQNIE